MERLVFWHRWLPPTDLDGAQLQRSGEWLQEAHKRLDGSGAHVVAQAGSTLVALFGVAQVAEAVELALEMLGAQERRSGEGVALSVAISVGTVAAPRPGAPAFGEAFERAQSLANAVNTGSLVLDVGAQQLLAGEYLFSDAVTSRDGVSGEVLDRAHPRRRDCRAALARLREDELRPEESVQFQELAKIAAGTGRQRTALIGPDGVGASRWLRALAASIDPPLWLDLSPVAGSLAPLGSLGYALRRLQRAGSHPERWLTEGDTRDRACTQALAAIREGRAMSRQAASGALRHLLARVHQKSGRRAWLSLNPVSQLDPATLRVVAEATRESGPHAWALLRLMPGQTAPSVFGSGARLHEIRMPALTHRDAHAIAQTLLGPDLERGIARKAALTGGPTVRGVLEAVRSMVSSGEVVLDREGFRWRRGPGGRGGVVPVETLLDERLEQLETAPRRLLEALVHVPDASEENIVTEVARLDGLRKGARQTAMELLANEGFIRLGPEGVQVAPLVRSVVTMAMPSARRAEMSRFIAQVLEGEGVAKAEFGRAALGYYYSHSDRAADAVTLFMETAQQAGKLGWIRTAVRLAAAAVHADPSAQTRTAAAALTRSLTRKAAPPRPPTEEVAAGNPFGQATGGPLSRNELPAPDSGVGMGQGAIRKAIQSLLARDSDEVERSLELATASGYDGAAVERLRAMALLARGDHQGALKLLESVRSEELASPRAILAEAIVWLDADRLAVALRTALRALAIARAQQDTLGIEAVLRTVATCYRRLGRDQDAVAIEQAV